MKSTIVGAAVAVLLFAVAAVSWKEAGLTRKMADAHRRLATLHYDADDDVEEAASVWSRVPLPVVSATEDMRRHRATVSYWLGRHDSLVGMAEPGSAAIDDPALMLVAANAAFRLGTAQTSNRRLVIERLDAVIQQYAEVLRRDAALTDAAFNYEYAVRMRDALAKPPARNAARKAPPKPPLVSVDLPTGPTIHGYPGAPPEGSDMSDFKTITPMRYDEREEQTDPGRGKELRRKG